MSFAHDESYLAVVYSSGEVLHIPAVTLKSTWVLTGYAVDEIT